MYVYIVQLSIRYMDVCIYSPLSTGALLSQRDSASLIRYSKYCLYCEECILLGH